MQTEVRTPRLKQAVPKYRKHPASGQVVVTIDGVEMASKPEVRVKQPSVRSLSLHLGVAEPRGTFANSYDSDLSLALDYSHHFTRQLSGVATLSYHRFDAGSSAVSDTYWWSISANAKYELTPNSLRPFVTSGVGLYKPESGSTDPGLNVGVGVDLDISPDWVLEAGIDYHHIFTSSSDTDFAVARIGLLYFFE